jgi:hypothetical protein
MNLQTAFETIQPALVDAAILIIVAVLTWLGNTVRNFLKANTTKKQREEAVGIIDGVVQFLDQVGTDRQMDNAAKKTWAVNTSKKLLIAVGQFLSDEELDIMIEAALARWKISKGPNFKELITGEIPG